MLWCRCRNRLRWAQKKESLIGSLHFYPFSRFSHYLAACDECNEWNPLVLIKQLDQVQVKSFSFAYRVVRVFNLTCFDWWVIFFQQLKETLKSCNEELKFWTLSPFFVFNDNANVDFFCFHIFLRLGGFTHCCIVCLPTTGSALDPKQTGWKLTCTTMLLCLAPSSLSLSHSLLSLSSLPLSSCVSYRFGLYLMRSSFSPRWTSITPPLSPISSSSSFLSLSLSYSLSLSLASLSFSARVAWAETGALTSATTTTFLPPKKLGDSVGWKCEPERERESVCGKERERKLWWEI